MGLYLLHIHNCFDLRAGVGIFLFLLQSCCMRHFWVELLGRAKIKTLVTQLMIYVWIFCALNSLANMTFNVYLNYEGIQSLDLLDMILEISDFLNVAPYRDVPNTLRINVLDHEYMNCIPEEKVYEERHRRTWIFKQIRMGFLIPFPPAKHHPWLNLTSYLLVSHVPLSPSIISSAIITLDSNAHFMLV